MPWNMTSSCTLLSPMHAMYLSNITFYEISHINGFFIFMFYANFDYSRKMIKNLDGKHKEPNSWERSWTKQKEQDQYNV